MNDPLIPQMPPSSADPATVNHAVAIALLQSDVEGLKASVDKMANEVKELTEAWRTAGGLVKFVKILAGVGTAIGVIYTVLKSYFQGS